jgi:hypothetical protein
MNFNASCGIGLTADITADCVTFFEHQNIFTALG